jgi:hypothetical protein
LRVAASVIALLSCLVAASPSSAAPSVESDVSVDGTKIHQEINVLAGDLHYWFKGTNASGVPEFCVTLRLERKRGGGWERIGRGIRRHRHFCCDADNPKCRPDSSTGVWDLFVYPNDRLWRRIKKGRLRVHAFTDLGPSLILRWRT